MYKQTSLKYICFWLRNGDGRAFATKKRNRKYVHRVTSLVHKPDASLKYEHDNHSFIIVCLLFSIHPFIHSPTMFLCIYMTQIFSLKICDDFVLLNSYMYWMFSTGSTSIKYNMNPTFQGPLEGCLGIEKAPASGPNIVRFMLLSDDGSRTRF